MQSTVFSPHEINRRANRARLARVRGDRAAGGFPGTPATLTPAASGARVHEVRMELVNGKYRYHPAALSLKAGDVVRWVNVSGGPHNVAFKREALPAGSAGMLNTAMKGRVMDLGGPYLKDSLATYDVSFAGAPPGTYPYACTPHAPVGMVATLIVSP